MSFHVCGIYRERWWKAKKELSRPNNKNLHKTCRTNTFASSTHTHTHFIIAVAVCFFMVIIVVFAATGLLKFIFFLFIYFRTEYTISRNVTVHRHRHLSYLHCVAFRTKSLWTGSQRNSKHSNDFANRKTIAHPFDLEIEDFYSQRSSNCE